METQRNPIGNSLNPSVVQRNFSDLFQFAHTHNVLSAVPAATDGQVGDIALVDTGSAFYLYAKFSSGWKHVTLS